MRRRDFVKAIVAVTATAQTVFAQQGATAVVPPTPAAVPTELGPQPWMRGLMEAKPLQMTAIIPDEVAQTNAAFFHPRQLATLRRLCEILLPPLKGYPGAVDAGAPEFLDFLIGVSPADRQRMYQNGLDRLDGEAMQQFGVAFAAVDRTQAGELIRPWLQTWMTDHPPTEEHAHFMNIAHSDIRTATINSQAWSEIRDAAGHKDKGIGLYWFPVDPDLRRESSTPIHHAAPPRKGRAVAQSSSTGVS